MGDRRARARALSLNRQYGGGGYASKSSRADATIHKRPENEDRNEEQFTNIAHGLKVIIRGISSLKNSDLKEILLRNQIDSALATQLTFR